MNWHIIKLDIVKIFPFLNPFRTTVSEFSDLQYPGSGWPHSSNSIENATPFTGQLYSQSSRENATPYSKEIYQLAESEKN